MLTAEGTTLDSGGFSTGSRSGRVNIHAGVADPRTVDDGSVPQGSVYHQKNGVTWKKVGVGASSWMPLLAGGFVTLSDTRQPDEDGSDLKHGKWNIRAITQSVDPYNLVRLIDDDFILPEGTYYIEAEAYGAGKLRLFDDSDGVALLDGVVRDKGNSLLRGVFTVAANTLLEVQHWVDHDIELKSDESGSPSVYFTASISHAN